MHLHDACAIAADRDKIDHMGKERYVAKKVNPEEAAWKKITVEHRQIKADLYMRVARVELPSLARNFGDGSGDEMLGAKNTLYRSDVELLINSEDPNEKDIHRALEIFQKSSANKKHASFEGPAIISSNLEPHLLAVFPRVGENAQIEISLGPQKLHEERKVRSIRDWARSRLNV